tara:strand:- start:3 stop:137 length:135 start_codon:yes stop_codon:yes gene_type:complete
MSYKIVCVLINHLEELLYDPKNNTDYRAALSDVIANLKDLKKFW